MRVYRSLLVFHFLTILCLLMVCLGSVPLCAQSTSSGTLIGAITDQSGAVVAGATVTITDTATKASRSVTTNDAGRYIFVDVTPGSYDLNISKQGFSTSRTQTSVRIGDATTVNMALQVGGSSVVVDVTAVGTELQTMNATVGNTVTSVALDNLPSIGRDVNTFIELQPGVAPDGSVAGAVVDESFFTLDGGNNTNDMDGAGSVYTSGVSANTIGDPTGGVSAQLTAYNRPSGVMPTPADSVEEFKVNTANQTADFNSSSGAEIKVVTKRGSNRFHGTAYEYYLDNNWSGNTWQNSYNRILFGPPAGGLPSFHYSRFGGAIGGPLLPKEILGGKTYFFFNYEGFRFPRSETYFRNVPSQNLKAGLLTDSNGTYSILTNDPRLIGPNAIVSQIWNSYMPASNSACEAGSQCDGLNIQGYAGTLTLPLQSKFAVVRVDHDFGSKQHFMASWRYFNQQQATDDQVDIGGALAGDKPGTPASLSGDPVEPWYLVTGLTTNITNNTTNDFHYSFLRNWWAWNRKGDVIQGCTLCAGMGGALEFESGQSKLQDLGPYNVNTQQTRTRFWDGRDQMFRDDLSMLKGNHLFQFGGTYQHNFNWHQRTDNGGGINYQPVYELGNGSSGSQLALPSGQQTAFAICSTTTVMGSGAKCDSLMSAALGIVSISQTAYTRSGANLTLNPPLTPASDQSTIPYYNVYFSDTWHMKPTLSLTYGLGWALEMPPVEKSGKQIEVVDSSGGQLDTMAYLGARRRAALEGQVYNPEVGFALVGDTGKGLKYPYKPFYGQFSPRIAVAWNPHFSADSMFGKVFGSQDTVIRGGFGRQYGRLNGVDLVLVPLLGTGLIQPVQCIGGATTAGCGANNSANVNTAFRIGTDGPVAPLPFATQTLPQPDFPGYNAIAAGAGEGLDINFRPNVIDSFDFTVQRQLNRRLSMELGYIGRRITHEYLPLDINAVPYMMTLGGQSFANAYQSVLLEYCGGPQGLGGGGCAKNAGAVTTQPFFEAAMNPAYCAGFASCTAAVVSHEGSNLAKALVWGMWSDLDKGHFNFGRSMMNTPIPGAAPCPGSTSPTPCGIQGQMTSGVGMNASVGTGNYNGAFVSLKMADWRGFTAQSNFTWSKALGEGALVQATSVYTAEDVFNLKQMYGRQGYDRRYTYNMFVVYSPPVYRSQSGLVGRALGGWTFASIFTAGSGTPIQVTTSTGASEEFGSGDNINFLSNENAIPIGPYTSGHAYNDPTHAKGQLPRNLFSNGIAEINNWRNPILGFDSRDGGNGILNGLPYWNMDLSVKKTIRLAEQVNLEFQGVFANVMNHNQWLDPIGNTGLADPSTFGTLAKGEAQPRQIEVGARVRF